MTIAILCEPSTREEIIMKGIDPKVEVYWVDSLSSLIMIDADAWFDLEFRNDPERNQQLEKLKNLFIGSSDFTCKELGLNCFRINDWPGMINRSSIEVATSDKGDKSIAETILQGMGWKFDWTPDIPGFISNRVVAGIINEAYHTFEAGTSSKEEIDIAMKLGTNYPYGPFEWSRKIGLKRIASLLEQISYKDNRYKPSAALIKDLHEFNS